MKVSKELRDNVMVVVVFAMVVGVGYVVFTSIDSENDIHIQNKQNCKDTYNITNEDLVERCAWGISMMNTMEHSEPAISLKGIFVIVALVVVILGLVGYVYNPSDSP